MVPGQDLKTWVERLPALADALGVHQIAATRRRPGVLALIIERRKPFTYVVPATRIPELAAEVDLSAVDVGDDEYGGPYTLRLRGTPLPRRRRLRRRQVRADVEPAARARADDPRRLGAGVDDRSEGRHGDRTRPGRCSTGGPAPARRHRPADRVPRLHARPPRRDARRSKRRSDITAETPYELLIIDELAMLTAYGDRSSVREALRLLAEVLTQGRAADLRGGVRAGTLQGRRRRPRTVRHPDLPRRHRRRARRHGPRRRRPRQRRTGRRDPRRPRTTPGSGSSSTPAPASPSASAPDWSPTPTSPSSPPPAHPAPTSATSTSASWGGTGRATHLIALPTPATADSTDGTTARAERRARHDHHPPLRHRPRPGGHRDHRRARRCRAGWPAPDPSSPASTAPSPSSWPSSPPWPCSSSERLGGPVGAGTPGRRRRRAGRRALAGRARAAPAHRSRPRPPRHPPERSAGSRCSGGGVMWGVTGWVLRTWLRITILLAARRRRRLAVAATRLAHPRRHRRRPRRAVDPAANSPANGPTKPPPPGGGPDEPPQPATRTRRPVGPPRTTSPPTRGPGYSRRATTWTCSSP